MTRTRPELWERGFEELITPAKNVNTDKLRTESLSYRILTYKLHGSDF